MCLTIFIMEGYMQTTEYEIRILEIDVEEFIRRIEEAGAVKVGEFCYRRYVYGFNPKVYEKWIRLRTDGNESTLTIKEIKDYTISGTKEKEIVVSDFDTTNEILNDLGYYAESYQENRRVRYMLEGVEIDIDTWPLIPTYVELEGKSEQEVYKALDKLHIEREKVVTLDVEGIFREIYGIDIAKIPELKF